MIKSIYLILLKLCSKSIYLTIDHLDLHQVVFDTQIGLDASITDVTFHASNAKAYKQNSSPSPTTTSITYTFTPLIYTQYII